MSRRDYDPFAPHDDDGETPTVSPAKKTAKRPPRKNAATKKATAKKVAAKKAAVKKTSAAAKTGRGTARTEPMKARRRG